MPMSHRNHPIATGPSRPSPSRPSASRRPPLAPRATIGLERLEPRRLLTRFAVVGDFSSVEQVEPTRDVAALVASWSPEFVVTVGDNNYPAGEAGTIDANIGQWYRAFISPYSGAFGPGAADGQNRFWPALGNHDWDSPTGAAPYTSYFALPTDTSGNERYYTVGRGNVQLFVLDTDPREPDGVSATSVQAMWLKAQLAASDAPWKLVISHHAPFSSGAGHGSHPSMDWPFRQWGATALISGHDHNYERVTRDSFTYFVNGLGGRSLYGFGSPVAGSQVRYADDYGAMLIDAGDASINFKFINRAGQTIDNLTLAAPPAPVTTLVPPQATWKFLDDGTSPAAPWRGAAFNDAAWKTGAGQLGYGDDDESTTVSFGPSAASKFVTTYFRRQFTVSNPVDLSSLDLSLLADDGAVVYLNGTEVYRLNMPAGAPASTTLAASAANDDAERAWHTIGIAPASLVAGDNVVAVEVHQSSAGSDDLSFDFALTAGLSAATGVPAAPDTLVASPAATGDRIELAWRDNASNEVGTRIERSTGGGAFLEIATVTSAAQSYVDRSVSPGASYAYRAWAYNAAGASVQSNVAAATAALPAASVALIPAGATWRYLDDGTNQGTAWRGSAFADAAWPAGPAQLGFGDGDEATLVYGGPTNSRFITTYFRKTFTVANPAAIGGLALSLLRDDGAVVYLNGTEIYRSNMPTGAITSATLATANVGGAEESQWFTAAVSPALLAPGDNVIAVEVHQSVATSSDLSFDLALAALLPATGPAAPLPPIDLASSVRSQRAVRLTWRDRSSNERGFRIERRTGDAGAWAQVAAVGAGVTAYDDVGLTPGERYYYRVRAHNEVGASAHADEAIAFTRPGETQSIVAAGALWRYLDNGSNQSTAWRERTFDHSAWASGAAQLGYGDGDEATIVSFGPSAASKHVTTYFRRSFTLGDPASIAALKLELLRDDGAVVYLNGTEVFRSNMPSGTISHNTLASSSTADESTFFAAAVDPALLMTGYNVIAVEVHQSAANSGDLSFDLRLTATLGGPVRLPSAPSALRAAALAGGGASLAWIDTVTTEDGFKIERSDDGGATYIEVATTPANVQAYTDFTAAPATSYLYRVRAYNVGGQSFHSGPASVTTAAAPPQAAAATTATANARPAHARPRPPVKKPLIERLELLT